MSSARVYSAELRPATESIPQDWSALACYLARLDTTFGPAPPRQFAGGFGNLNYLIEIDSEPAVLRLPPNGPLPPGANDMARENRILSTLCRASPLAPRPLFYCAAPAVLGRPFHNV